jgi:hypothetical protein
MKTILYAVILAASIVSNNNNFVLCEDVEGVAAVEEEEKEESCTSLFDFACNNENFTSLCDLINYVDLPDDFAFKTGFAPNVSVICLKFSRRLHAARFFANLVYAITCIEG